MATTTNEILKVEAEMFLTRMKTLPKWCMVD